MTGSLDVVVVSYHSGSTLPALLRTLAQNSRLPFRLILQDNTQDRVPLTRLWNRLGSRGTAEFLCFLNPDTLVAPEWDLRLVAALEADERLGLVGPRTTHGHPGQMVPAFVPTPEVLEQLAARSMGEPVVETDLYGFCIMTHRGLWERTGRFDERFRLYGQDSEYAWRVRELGLRTACVRSAFVWHEGSHSVNQARKMGEIDFHAEAQHSAGLFQSLRAGQTQRWDLLSKEERQEAITSTSRT